VIEAHGHPQAALHALGATRNVLPPPLALLLLLRTLGGGMVLAANIIYKKLLEYQHMDYRNAFF
jgi:hypothetical protein